MTTDAIEVALIGTSSGTPGAPESSEAQPPALDAEVRTMRETLGQLQTELKDTREQAKKAWNESRAAHAAADAHADRLRKQFMERERHLFDALPQFGLDAKDVQTLTEQHAREVELDELRERVATSDAQTQKERAMAQKELTIRQACEQAGVDPTDQRLDLANPASFYQSLARVVKEDALGSSSAGEPSDGEGQDSTDRGKGRHESRARSARDDLDVLGGGGAGVIKELPEDTDELWKLAKRQIKSLKGKS